MKTIMGHFFGLFFLLPAIVMGSEVKVPHVAINLGNQVVLQKGARTFHNYCAGCHSVQYMRYNRVARDLGIPEKIMKEELIFSSARVVDTMSSAMHADDGKKWFGMPAPDLSLIARQRGTDWLYAYLTGFYLDESKPFGINNTVFPNVSMPHVLAPLQGLLEPVHDDSEESANHHGASANFKMVKPGLMTPEEYNQTVKEIVTYLAYLGEPTKLLRISLGIKVLVVIFIFGVLFYALKQEFWKDVH